MTLSERKLYLTLGLMLFSGLALAADPPDAELSAAATAIAAASRIEPRGQAAEQLARAQASLALAEQAMARRKYRDALRLAEQARAEADLALARGQLAEARGQYEEKAARNADLRRQLLMRPEPVR